MGKCLSCCKEDQNFQPNCPADKVISDPLLHHGTSSIIQPSTSLDLKTSRPPMRKVGVAGGSKYSSSQSSTSTCSFSSENRYSLLVKFQKSSASFHRQQSRANFDSQEKIIFNDLTSSSGNFGFRFQRPFSAPKLSIISCYESCTVFTLQPSNENILNSKETAIVFKKSYITDTEKHVSSCTSVYNKHFMDFQTRADSSARGNLVDRSVCQHRTSTYFSLPSLTSYSYQQNGIATDIQERSQLNEDSLYSDFQSVSTDHPPAMTQQHPSESVSSPVLHNVGFSLFHNNTRNVTPFQNEVTADYFEDESIANSSQDEDKSSPIEIPKIRYITANTDTEEQSFPVSVALNTHAEELNLDALLQKVDNLRTNETSKMESFELLCDYKEKFRDEVEFIWRFSRAYGDMYELSTNTQEKKHYANIGKTLGEKAITRAPMNGHCHLWYAVLCGHVSEFEGLQNKINYGHRFKEHLDKAIQFLPEEPFLYYLTGRYCYTVSKLSWIEKKMAATLFGKIPSSTVQEALQNFLKVEELHPGFSKSNYMFLAKCYMDLRQIDNARKFCNLAMLLPCVTKEELK
uniref:Regulator of microtubule dynamics protein 2 n=2 Tax=Rhinolophus ferrumequinum TaxID=59479 RepID=A0A671ESY3_RHIFE